MNSQLKCLSFKKLLLPFCLLLCSNLFNNAVIAQEHPPRPITVAVSTLQHLNFGTMIPIGSGGTVTVTYDGARTFSGSIILPPTGTFSSPALFQVTALPGTLITINNGPDVFLSGSNGGTLRLTIGPSKIGSPFITTSASTDVFVGGTLTVGSIIANPAGYYQGTFTVTFIQQ